MNTAFARRAPVPVATTLVLAGNLLLAPSAMGASSHSLLMQKHLNSIVKDKALAASGGRASRRERFETLSNQWRRDTQFLSSPTDIAMHPAYQAIIGMGADALPLILQELENHSGYWYWALKAIANEDPVPPKHRGSVKQMRKAWLQWGRAKGLLAP